MPQDFIDRSRARRNQGAEDFSLWDEHVTAYQVFTECSGQWRMFPSSGMQKRLYYQALERQTVISIIKDIFCIPKPDRPELLREIRLIEQGALEALNDG